MRTVPSQNKWAEKTSVLCLRTGIHLRYLEAGNPQGPPAILIHGFSDSSRIWRKVMLELQEDYHLYAVDLRGFGQTDKPDQAIYTISSHVEDIRAFMDAHEILQAIVIGHSLGAFVSTALAYSYPERVSHLVLVSAALRRHETAEEIRAMTESYRSFCPACMTDEELLSQFLPAPETCADSDFPRNYLITLRGLTGSSLKAGKLGMMQHDGRGLAQFITAKILVVWGTRDDIFTEEYQQELQEFLPEFTFVAIEGALHDIPSTLPVQLAEKIRTFLLKR